MSDLLTKTSAVISPCQMYRYELRRVWDDRLPLLPVCMLNPSTADASVNDPTILTLIHFGKLWGYGGLLVVNLYAFRSSSPAIMAQQGRHAFGPDNDRHIKQTIRYAAQNGGKLLAAWGNGGDSGGYHNYIALTARDMGVDLVCLGTTKSGQPKHPLARGKYRVARDQQPIAWRAA
jgi:hypothetical protein